jgi:hypothetical protein
MASKIRLVDGRDLTIALDPKRVIEALSQAAENSDQAGLARFKTSTGTRVWINPHHVAAIEDRPDLD